MIGYGRSITLDLPFHQAVAKVKDTFKAKGFGTLVEIDVRATLKEKIGVDVEPYVILGVCNPPLAHRALEAEPDVGLLLPCNVILRTEGGHTIVAALDPGVIAQVTGNPALEEIAAEARVGIEASLDALAG